MKVIFRELDGEGNDVILGELLLENNRVVADPDSEQLEELAAGVNHEIERMGDAEVVLRHLPIRYSSAYLRAEVEE